MKYQSVSYFVLELKYIFKLDIKMFLTRIQYSMRVVSKEQNSNSLFTVWWLACWGKTMMPYKAP